MSRELSLTERRTQIDGRLERALSSADSGRLAPAWTTISERDNRWYGQLLALSHNSVATTPMRSSVLPAATAIELLRGYVRLREQLIRQLGNEVTDSLQWEVTPALLASDYLYTSAYSMLGSLTDDHIAECLEEFTAVSKSIIETLGRNYIQSTPSPTKYCSFIDDTAGALGRGAAAVGATLADIDEPHRDHFATLGRGFGTVCRIQHLLASDGASIKTDSSLTERRLRQHAKQRLREAEHALQQLSPTVDVSSLRTLVTEALSESTADTILD